MFEQGLRRRTFLKRLAIAGVAGPTLLSGCAQLSQMAGRGGGDVQIAGLNSLSGSLAQPGQDTEKGNKLAIQEAGQVLGRGLKFVSLDSQGNVDRGVRVASEAMTSQGVKYFEGLSLSSVALAVSDEVNRDGGLLVTSVGADEVTGKDCKKSTFRWSVPTYGAIRETVAPLLKMDPSLKRWYSITPNYVFGESLLRNAQDVLKEQGAELIGNETHSLQETEFSSYLSKVMPVKPDVLLILNFGDQSARTVRQAVEFGAKSSMKILVAWSEGLSQLQGLGPEISDGIYFGCQYWHTIDSPLNKQLIKLTQDAYQQVPNYPLAAGYIGVKLIIDGMRKANSAEPKDVIKALEGYEYDGLTGKERVRAEDHQVVKNYYLLKGKAKEQMKDPNDLADIISQGDSAIPVDQTGCTMA